MRNLLNVKWLKQTCCWITFEASPNNALQCGDDVGVGVKLQSEVDLVKIMMMAMMMMMKMVVMMLTMTMMMMMMVVSSYNRNGLVGDYPTDYSEIQFQTIWHYLADTKRTWFRINLKSIRCFWWWLNARINGQYKTEANTFLESIIELYYNYIELFTRMMWCSALKYNVWFNLHCIHCIIYIQCMITHSAVCSIGPLYKDLKRIARAVYIIHCIKRITMKNKFSGSRDLRPR